ALDGVRAHVTPEGEARLARVRSILRQVEEEIRRVAHELRPVVLDDLGLLPALRFLGEGGAQRAGLTVTVEGATQGRVPPRIETELYRMTQEALSNVARHAHASQATIDVRCGPGEVRIDIRDDGRGFDPAAASLPGARRGLGLDGIRER